MSVQVGSWLYSLHLRRHSLINWKLKIVAVNAVAGAPSQMRVAVAVPRNLLLWSDSYGRLRRMASGKTHVVTSASAFVGRLSCAPGPQMVLHPSHSERLVYGRNIRVGMEELLTVNGRCNNAITSNTRAKMLEGTCIYNPRIPNSDVIYRAN